MEPGSQRRPSEFGASDVICHACGQVDVAGSVCRACGSPLGRICPSCSFENVAESRFCGGCGKVLHEAQVEDALGERRQITCLFVDLVGSTELSQRLDPEDLRDLLGSYQTVCSDAVEVHGGHIAQFLGDGIVIYFGYPRSHEDDAQRAVRCALDILEEIGHLNDRDGVEGLAIRLGAHTGRVVVGPVGAGDRRDRIALGDTPNIAARIEGEADLGTVAVSDTTWQLVSGSFTGRSVGQRVLRGVEQPVPIWIVESRTRSFDRIDNVSTLSPLVGRDGELEKLTAIIDRSWTTSTSRFVVIRGEAGVGKSRLMRLLRERYDREGSTYLARSTPALQNNPFAPIRELLRGRLGLGDVADPVALIEAHLERRGLRSDAAAAHLADVLGVPLPERVVRSNDSPTRQRIQTMELLVQLLIRTAVDAPTLLLVEDVHWADASTLEWIGRVIRSAPNVPLAVCLATRPDLEAAWMTDANVEIVEPSRLDNDEVATLAETVAGGKSLPRVVLHEIVERSDGVPLFVEELTRTALESGQLVERSATWEAFGTIEQGFIPASVDSSLTARIDRIGGSRATAQLAAAIGREFDLRFLTAVSVRPAETVEADVKSMIDGGLAVYADADHHRVVFKHALIRDAAYNTLLRTARRGYHRRIADGYAAWGADVSPDVVAHHLHEAGDHGAAAPLWMAAGQANLLTSSLFEAARHLALAIECVQHLDPTPEVRTQELELQIQIWPLWAATEGWGSSNVEAACQRGLELATDLERYDLLYVPLWGLWTVYFLRGEMDSAIGTARQVHQMAGASGIPMIQLTSEHALGYSHLFRGELDEAFAAAERGLGLFDVEQERVIADTFQLASSLALLAIRGDVNYLRGSVTAAERDWQQLDRLARDLEHPPSLAAGLAFLLHSGALRASAHGTDHIRPVVDELIEVTEKEGSLLWNAVAKCFLATAVTDDREADQSMEIAWELFAQTGSRLTEVLTRVLYAETRLRRGDVAGAERDLALAEAAMQQRGEGLLAPEIWRLRARLAAGANDLVAAESAIEESLRLADRQGAPMLRLRTLLDSLDIIDATQRDDVLRAIAETVVGFDADDEPDVTRARLLLANEESTDHRHATELKGERHVR